MNTRPSQFWAETFIGGVAGTRTGTSKNYQCTTRRIGIIYIQDLSPTVPDYAENITPVSSTSGAPGWREKSVLGALPGGGHYSYKPNKQLLSAL